MEYVVEAYVLKELGWALFWRYLVTLLRDGGFKSGVLFITLLFGPSTLPVGVRFGHDLRLEKKIPDIY